MFLTSIIPSARFSHTDLNLENRKLLESSIKVIGVSFGIIKYTINSSHIVMFARIQSIEEKYMITTR